MSEAQGFDEYRSEPCGDLSIVNRQGAQPVRPGPGPVHLNRVYFRCAVDSEAKMPQYDRIYNYYLKYNKKYY